MAFLGYTQKNASTLGNRLGGDIADVLHGLAEHKAQNVKVSNNRQFLNSLGINPQVSSQLAHKDDEFIGNFLKQFEGFDIGNQNQGSQAAPQGYQQAMGGLTPQQQETGYSPNQPNLPKNQVNQQPSGVSDLVRGLYAANPGLENQISPEQIGQLLQNQATQQALHPNSNQQQQQVQPKGIVPKATADRIAKEALELKKEKHEQEKHDRDRSEKEQAESKKFLKEINQDATAAKNNNTRLNRMEELIKTGKLSNPTFYNVLNTAAKGIWGFGIDLKNSQNPESQEFEKLSNDMIKGIKDIFGARVTNLDVESFMKTIPTLGQSNQAKQRVISNLKIFNEGQLVKQQVAKDIIKENGYIPADLELLVDERASDKLDALSESFKNQVAQEVPGTQRLIPNVVRGVGNLFVG